MEPTEKLDVQLTDAQKELLDALKSNNIEVIKRLLPKANFNFCDENGLTPLQHACYKGNKEVVQIMLDTGADIHFNKHACNYTALHLAALSGNTAVCRLLLDAGIDANAVNSVNRTAAQMAAFVGNHACVETINNYVKREVLEYYTKPHGQQKEPLIHPTQLTAFHEFIIGTNLHPVRVALNLQSLGLHNNLEGLKRALELMCEKEMKKSDGANEVLALKFHYLHWIVKELMRVKKQRLESAKSGGAGSDVAADKDKSTDYIEFFMKRILKENKQEQLDYLEYVVREAVREFPFWESTIFRQIAQTLAEKEPLPALIVLRRAINGHRGFSDETGYCSACGNEKPDKKCSKCKAVQYCDRECQRLHWSTHKKSCARLVSTGASSSTAATTTEKPTIDANELREELKKITLS